MKRPSGDPCPLFSSYSCIIAEVESKDVISFYPKVDSLITDARKDCGIKRQRTLLPDNNNIESNGRS